jgi:hypothetical protein
MTAKLFSVIAMAALLVLFICNIVLSFRDEQREV